VLANPYQIKNIPWQKTDRRDSEWIADLLAHGEKRSKASKVVRYSRVRRVLLLYKPNRFVTWVPRGFYWLSLLSLLLSLLTLPIAFPPIGVLIALVIGFGPALLFFWLDQLIDGPVIRLANN
jgi:hypothetical protein